MRPTTRFAPSTTGLVHLGHVAHMLYVWGLAGVVGGRVLLRIEDHDRQRCRQRFETALLRDLDWLGFRPDNRVADGPSEFRQSDCDGVYAEALERLAGSARVYRCVCTRRTLAGLRPSSPGTEVAYPGICRDADHPRTVSHSLRLAWPGDASPERFEDGLLGPQRQRPELQCGDPLLRDRVGQWTYQFAVTVDDLRHGVDLVVRGADLLESTGRQIRLARILGRRVPPRFFHHPLIRDRAGVKLSKRQRSPPVRDLRRSGVSSGAVLGEAAHRVGLASSAGAVSADDAPLLVERVHGGTFGARGAAPRGDSPQLG